MTKKIEKYQIKATIKTPIHIWSGENYDRMDYFLIEDKLKIVKQQWLEDLASKDENLFKDILKSIETGNFIKLEELKDNYYKNYFNKNFQVEEIELGENALDSLQNTGQKNNRGIIKRHFENKFTNKAMIPGSTLKGLFRTIYFFYKYEDVSYYEELKRLYQQEKFKKLKKELNKKQNELEKNFNSFFSNLYFEDVLIENQKKSIQFILGANKKNTKGKVQGVPQIVETVEKGDFNIDITAFFKDKKHNIDFDPSDFAQAIVEYSKKMIEREKKILDNLGLETDFINELYDLYDSGKYPIKIGMFKKSLAYKLYWEDILKDFVYTRYDKKRGEKIMDNKASRDFGVGDKSIYLDEDKQPMGWIILEF